MVEDKVAPKGANTLAIDDRKNMYIIAGVAVIIVVVALLWWSGLLRLP